MEKISQRCEEKRQSSSPCLTFNLNGEYVFQDPQFVMQVVALLPRVSVLFGNRNEFRAFVSSSRRLGYKSAILNGIMSVVDNLDRPRLIMEQQERDKAGEDEGELLSRTTVVVTDGPSPVLAFDVTVSSPPPAPAGSVVGGGVARVRNLRSVESPPVSAGEIVDTIGAGDSFVAGYAQAMMKIRDDAEGCIKRGVI